MRLQVRACYPRRACLPRRRRQAAGRYRGRPQQQLQVVQRKMGLGLRHLSSGSSRRLPGSPSSSTQVSNNHRHQQHCNQQHCPPPATPCHQVGSTGGLGPSPQEQTLLSVSAALPLARAVGDGPTGASPPSTVRDQDRGDEGETALLVKDRFQHATTLCKQQKFGKLNAAHTTTKALLAPGSRKHEHSISITSFSIR